MHGAIQQRLTREVGSTNTNAPVVIKDKVLTGISGGEFGVRGFVAAYEIADRAPRRGRATASGPDSGPARSIRAERRTSGKPVGKDSILKTWQGDQWKIGGGTTWGWYHLRPRA